MFIKHLFCQITSSCASRFPCASRSVSLLLSRSTHLHSHRSLFALHIATSSICAHPPRVIGTLGAENAHLQRYCKRLSFILGPRCPDMGAVPYARHPPHSFASMSKIFKPLYIVINC